MELLLKAVSVRRGMKSSQRSYVATLSYGDVVRLIDDQRLYVPNDPDLDDFAQRKLNSKRIKSISQYILDTYRTGGTFFPPICVNVQPAPDFQDGTLYLSYSSATLRLTDGQHRCLGIYKLIKQLQEQSSPDLSEVSSLELGVLMYSSLPLALERQAFRDQNLLANRPGKSLSHLFDMRSIEVKLVKGLCKFVPQFRENIEKVENGLGVHNPKLMTLSTLVTSTQHMFPHTISEDSLEAHLGWAVAFWTAAASSLSDDPWRVMTKAERKEQRQSSIVGAAIVFQSLALVGRDLYAEEISSQNLNKWLVCLSSINWNKQDDFWLEKGVTQLNAKGSRIIQNTRTTVNTCYHTLRELLGVTPEDGLLA